MRTALLALLTLLGCASTTPASVLDAAVDAAPAPGVDAAPAPGADAAREGGVAPSVLLATGARAWQPLPSDGSGVAEVVFGPQGGYHIFGRVRMEGLAPDVTLLFRVTSPDGTRVLTDDRDRIRRVVGRGLLQAGDGAYESTSGELVILQIHSPMEVMGQRWRMEVRVMPADQSPTVTDVREFTIVDDEP